MTASTRAPNSRISGLAAISASSVRSSTVPSALSTTRVFSSPCALEVSSMTLAIAPGPASIGIAIGKTDTSSTSGLPAWSATTFSARCSRRWVRFSNTMSSAITNSMMPPAMRKLSSSMCSAFSRSSPNSAKITRITPAIRQARIAMLRCCAALAPLVSPA